MDRRSRIMGCFLAGACGDALGYPVEFTSMEKIRHRFGPRGVREMTCTAGYALITDDTQMTLFTAEGMLCSLRHDRDVTECIYHAYLDWLYTQGRQQRGDYHEESGLLRAERMHRLRAPGMACLGALGSGKMGTVEEPVNDSKGCGGVMRTAPCGMLSLLPEEGEDAYALQGARAAAITHGHLMGYVPAAMLADMVHLILTDGESSLEQIVRASLNRVCRLFGPEVSSAEGCEEEDRETDGSGELAKMLTFRELMNRAIRLSREDLPEHLAIRRLGEGWVGDEALAIAVYCCLKHPSDMEACLSAAVTHGGDSDSTGAIAGNILGAWLGAEAIPSRWLAELELREVIARVADDMSRAMDECGQ